MSNESDNRYEIINDSIFNDFMIDLFYFKLSSFISKLYITFHSRKELIKCFSRQKFIEYKVDYKTCYLEYHKTVVHSMAKPYETNCMDYRDVGFDSRNDCINKCRIRAFQDQWPNKWPGYYLTDNTSSQLKIDDSYEMFGTNLTFDFLFGSKCRPICEARTECYSEYYDLKFKIRGLNFNDSNYLSVASPMVPDLIYTQSPEIHVEEFLTFIGSVVSLWFGFSIIILPKILNTSYKKFKNNIINSNPIMVQILVGPNQFNNNRRTGLGRIEHKLHRQRSLLSV